jgi:hypothetical protein
MPVKVECWSLTDDSESNGRAGSKRDGVRKADRQANGELARYAGTATKTFCAEAALFRAGDRDPKFFVIFLLIRGDDFCKSMSSYLADRIIAVGEGSRAIQFVHEYLKTM